MCRAVEENKRKSVWLRMYNQSTDDVCKSILEEDLDAHGNDQYGSQTTQPAMGSLESLHTQRTCGGVRALLVSPNSPASPPSSQILCSSTVRRGNTNTCRDTIRLLSDHFVAPPIPSPPPDDVRSKDVSTQSMRNEKKVSIQTKKRHLQPAVLTLIALTSLLGIGLLASSLFAIRSSNMHDGGYDASSSSSGWWLADMNARSSWSESGGARVLKKGDGLRRVLGERIVGGTTRKQPGGKFEEEGFGEKEDDEAGPELDYKRFFSDTAVEELKSLMIMEAETKTNKRQQQQQQLPHTTTIYECVRRDFTEFTKRHMMASSHTLSSIHGNEEKRKLQQATATSNVHVHRLGDDHGGIDMIEIIKVKKRRGGTVYADAETHQLQTANPSNYWLFVAMGMHEDTARGYHDPSSCSSLSEKGPMSEFATATPPRARLLPIASEAHRTFYASHRILVTGGGHDAATTENTSSNARNPSLKSEFAFHALNPVDAMFYFGPNGVITKWNAAPIDEKSGRKPPTPFRLPPSLLFGDPYLDDPRAPWNQPECFFERVWTETSYDPASQDEGSDDRGGRSFYDGTYDFYPWYRDGLDWLTTRGPPAEVGLRCAVPMSILHDFYTFYGDGNVSTILYGDTKGSCLLSLIFNNNCNPYRESVESCALRQGRERLSSVVNPRCRMVFSPQHFWGSLQEKVANAKKSAMREMNARRKKIAKFWASTSRALSGHHNVKSMMNSAKVPLLGGETDKLSVWLAAASEVFNENKTVSHEDTAEGESNEHAPAVQDDASPPTAPGEAIVESRLIVLDPLFIPPKTPVTMSHTDRARTCSMSTKSVDSIENGHTLSKNSSTNNMSSSSMDSATATEGEEAAAGVNPYIPPSKRTLADFGPPRQCANGAKQYPFSFGVARRNFSPRFSPKIFDFLPIPIQSKDNRQSLHLFDEEIYDSLGALSYFSYTQARGGWECLRHHQQLSVGSVPYFVDLLAKPRFVQTNFPLEMMREVIENTALVHMGHIAGSRVRYRQSEMFWGFRSRPRTRIIRALLTKKLIRLVGYENITGYTNALIATDANASTSAMRYDKNEHRSLHSQSLIRNSDASRLDTDAATLTGEFVPVYERVGHTGVLSSTRVRDTMSRKTPPSHMHDEAMTHNEIALLAEMKEYFEQKLLAEEEQRISNLALMPKIRDTLNRRSRLFSANENIRVLALRTQKIDPNKASDHFFTRTPRLIISNLAENLAHEAVFGDIRDTTIVAKSVRLPMHHGIDTLFNETAYFTLGTAKLYHVRQQVYFHRPTGTINHDVFDKDWYWRTARKMKRFAYERMSSEAVVGYVLKTMGAEDARNVLVIHYGFNDYSEQTIELGLDGLGINTTILRDDSFHTRECVVVGQPTDALDGYRTAEATSYAIDAARSARTKDKALHGFYYSSLFRRGRGRSRHIDTMEEAQAEIVAHRKKQEGSAGPKPLYDAVIWTFFLNAEPQKKIYNSEIQFFLKEMNGTRVGMINGADSWFDRGPATRLAKRVTFFSRELRNTFCHPDPGRDDNEYGA